MSASEKHILVVDDAISMRKFIIKTLMQQGYREFTEAEDGVQALDILTQSVGGKKIDLVILDWSMPRMNGFELLEKMKNNSLLQTIPVLMVTAESLYDHVIQALRVGAKNYIIKPFTPDLLIEKVEKILR
ncbi:MAG: response regulator [SAR324 cluster bacterium]|nr:response regulator [SAR324 cluster bacterium]